MGKPSLGKRSEGPARPFSMACRIFSVLRCPKRAAFFIGVGGGASGVDGRHFLPQKGGAG